MWASGVLLNNFCLLLLTRRSWATALLLCYNTYMLLPYTLAARDPSQIKRQFFRDNTAIDSAKRHKWQLKQIWRGQRQGKETVKLIISSIFQVAPRPSCDHFAALITLQAVTSGAPLVFKILFRWEKMSYYCHIVVLTFPANLPFAADICAFMKMLFVSSLTSHDCT